VEKGGGEGEQASKASNKATTDDEHEQACMHTESGEPGCTLHSGWLAGLWAGLGWLAAGQGRALSYSGSPTGSWLWLGEGRLARVQLGWRACHARLYAQLANNDRLSSSMHSAQVGAASQAEL